MPTPRFLALSVLLAVGAASAAAQSVPNPAAPKLTTPTVPAKPTTTPAQNLTASSNPFQHILQTSAQQSATDHKLIAKLNLTKLAIAPVETCYAMRSYNYTPDSSAPQPSGSSTCTSSTQLKLKTTEAYQIKPK